MYAYTKICACLDVYGIVKRKKSTAIDKTFYMKLLQTVKAFHYTSYTCSKE